MPAMRLTRMLQHGLLAHLFFFSLVSLSVSAEFSEEASKQGKFNVLPRGGHQWAVGHFMGKKSLQESPRQSETELLSSVLFPPRSAEDVWGQFLQELRRASSLSQMDESQRVLRKILEQYIKSSRK